MENNNSTIGPIYFGIAVWGRSFCESFVNCALASLLAEGNIPALDNLSGKNSFLIYTTAEDRRWLESQVMLKQLKRFMIVEFMEMTPISERSYQKLNNGLHSSKLYTMTLGHRWILERMYQDKATGSIVLADSIYANKSIPSAYQYILKGKTSVFVLCPRFSLDSIVDALEEQKIYQRGKPLTIESRDLVKVAIQNLHIDMLMEQWEAPYIPEFMMEASWILPDESGMLFHTWSAWCSFINYSLLLTHNMDSLEHNTVDGVYFGANLKKEETHFITDSDEFTLISFSPHIHRRLTPLKIHNKILAKSLINSTKKTFVRNFLKRDVNTHTDSFKIEFALQPVFMHTKDLTPACHALSNETHAIMSNILHAESSSFENKITDVHEFYRKENAELKYMVKLIYKTGISLLNQVYVLFRKINLFLLNKIMVVINPVINLFMKIYGFLRAVFLFLLNVGTVFVLKPLKRSYKLANKIYKVLSLKIMMTLMTMICYRGKKVKMDKKGVAYYPIPESFIKNNDNL